MDHLVALVLRALAVLVEQMELADHQEVQVLQDLVVQQELVVHLVRLVAQDLLAHQDLLAQVVLLEVLEHLVQDLILLIMQLKVE
jgi:hypothetical protein